MAQGNNVASALTEQDFLGEMPIVLSVSRLAQRLDEAPGAVTILDRNFIRMSGARDVADLLRVVPGFQTTTTFETDAPMASYHGRVDDFSNRIQVMIDGRSVYSTHLQSSSGLGLQTLAMDDIERIEIFRGSNSAAYGARAFLGVINIVSRHVNDTLQSAAALTTGENGINDAGARIGWADGDAAYRISADTRGDAGLRGAYGANRVGRVNFSNRMDFGADGDVALTAGSMDVRAGRGGLNDTVGGNLPRMRTMGSQFAQLAWHKNYDDETELIFNASHGESTYVDVFPYIPEPGQSPALLGLPIDFSGQEINDTLLLQINSRLNSDLRIAYGSELRTERVISRTSFDDRGQVQSDFFRIFGSAEWHVTPKIVVNAGGLAEHSTLGGDSFSPRLMLNWHAADGHTLRAGVSTAFRPPSPFEKYGLVNYYLNGAVVATTVKASGNLVPEKIQARELGYHFTNSGRGLVGDFRVFSERISDGIGTLNGVSPSDFVNMDNYDINGAELQVEWKPAASTRVLLSSTWADIPAIPGSVPVGLQPDWHPYRVVHSMARFSGALSLMHSLPTGVDVSVVFDSASDACLMSCRGTYSMSRTDLRVAKRFKWGKNNAEFALTVQNLNVPYADGDRQYFFDPRTFVTMRIEN